MHIFNFQRSRHFGNEYSFKATIKGNTIPIVSNDAYKKVIKKYLFAYLIYVRDTPTPNMSNNGFFLNESDNQSDLQKEQVNVNNDASKLNDFLKTYDSCFVDSIPNKLPPP